MQRSENLQRMWEEYKSTSRVALRNQLIEAYLPLVDYLAERMAERLPRCVHVDEVRSAGVLGLLGAVEGFDITRGIKFETYCSVRVRGSILDELRARDWVPRLVRSRAEKFHTSVRRLQSKLGRAPEPREVMKELGLSTEEFERSQKELGWARQATYSLSSSADADDDAQMPSHQAALVDQRHPDPAETLQRQEATGVVMGELDPKERELLKLYYFDGLTMKEVGRRLNLSESRVCQIHGQALSKLRDEFGGRLDEL